MGMSGQRQVRALTANHRIAWPQRSVQPRGCGHCRAASGALRVLLRAGSGARGLY
jgi:hypothetical protein